MPTHFSAIYKRAVSKFKDYSFLREDIQDVKKAIMCEYLMSAIADFQHACTADLTKYNIETEEFGVELDNEMIEILALGVAYHWISSKALNSELLKTRIHNKDYTSYSPGNLLKEIHSIKNTIGAEYRGKINTYSFRYGTLS